MSRPEPHFHGAEFVVRRLAGATATRVVHPGAQAIAEHAHDWPVLSFYRMGAYRERGEAGEESFSGPSVILHPPRAAHADEIGDTGLETLVLEFDPAWLGRPLERSRYWKGGRAALEAQRLARLWLSPQVSSERLQAETRAFVDAALGLEEARAPSWLEAVEAAADEADCRRLAERLDLNPAWLARAYRAYRGEGLREALRRRRVERAVALIRRGEPLAAAAADAGFCDQSHMNRAFLSVLGRTPGEVRAETAELTAA